MNYDFEDSSREFPPKYRVVSAGSPSIEKFENFKDAIEYCKTLKESLSKIDIGDREVCTIKNECGRLYISEAVELTKPELDVLHEIPVYHKIAFKSLLEKYASVYSDKPIEDLSFIKELRGGKPLDGLRMILELWNRYWEVRIRLRGDNRDGFYIIKERDVLDPDDKNTLNVEI
jgi:hypothetical protein